MTSDYEARNISAMRYLIAGVVLMTLGCGEATAVQQQAAASPEAATCTIDGQLADGCYAASKGGGAVFGLALTRGTPWTGGFLGFFFDASTLSRGASTFPAPNNDMNYDNAMNSCDGTGSATWTNGGTFFCVTTAAKCEASTPTTHTACVPSSLLN